MIRSFRANLGIHSKHTAEVETSFNAALMCVGESAKLKAGGENAVKTAEQALAIANKLYGNDRLTNENDAVEGKLRLYLAQGYEAVGEDEKAVEQATKGLESLKEVYGAGDDRYLKWSEDFAYLALLLDPMDDDNPMGSLVGGVTEVALSTA